MQIDSTWVQKKSEGVCRAGLAAEHHHVSHHKRASSHPHPQQSLALESLTLKGLGQSLGQGLGRGLGGSWWGMVGWRLCMLWAILGIYGGADGVGHSENGIFSGSGLASGTSETSERPLQDFRLSVC
jgi:hypothetical protein